MLLGYAAYDLREVSLTADLQQTLTADALRWADLCGEMIAEALALAALRHAEHDDDVRGVAGV